MSESRAISKALASGFVFDAKAFGVIERLPPEFDVDALVDRVLTQKKEAQAGPRVITEEDVKHLLPSDIPTDSEPKLAPVDIEGDVQVVSDPTLSLSPVEANSGFRALFNDRYERLLTVVKKRPDSRGMVDVAQVKNSPAGQKVKFAGLLSNKSNRRTGVDVTIDDPSGSLRINSQDEFVMKAALEAPLDSVVVAEAQRNKSGQLRLESLVLPDVPDRRPVVSSHRVYAVLLSDLHIGSKMFLAEDFQRFIGWLNGKFGDLDIVTRIRYVVIAGDLIDGVGVYPGQEFQLSERDPKKQYAAAARLLEQFPPHIQVLIAPGNHDPVRQALPQPAVSLDLAEPLYGLPNVRWVGDPAYVKLNGVTFLVFHGKSLDDVIATTPNLAYSKPADAMKLLLRARHLAPTYGKRTALSPELRDFMVIDPVPEVLHSGHVHTFDEINYRGTLLVNSGTWQAQTSFQSNMGVEPTPSIIPIVDLSTLHVIRRNFGAAGFALA